MDQEGGGPGSPFFPSSAETTGRGRIPSNFFLTSATCGRCHRDIYEQWNSSMHHFASFNNQWYRKSIEYMQDVVGTRPKGVPDVTTCAAVRRRFDQPVKQRLTSGAQAVLSCTHAMRSRRCTAHGTVGGVRDRVPAIALSGGELECVASHRPMTRSSRCRRGRPVKRYESVHREHREFCRRAAMCPRCAGQRKPGLAGFNVTTTGGSGVSVKAARVYIPHGRILRGLHMPLVPDDPAATAGRFVPTLRGR